MTTSPQSPHPQTAQQSPQKVHTHTHTHTHTPKKKEEKKRSTDPVASPATTISTCNPPTQPAFSQPAPFSRGNRNIFRVCNLLRLRSLLLLLLVKGAADAPRSAPRLQGRGIDSSRGVIISVWGRPSPRRQPATTEEWKAAREKKLIYRGNDCLGRIRRLNSGIKCG